MDRNGYGNGIPLHKGPPFFHPCLRFGHLRSLSKWKMYRVSPAEVSKAEGELIRCEGVISALDAEFERKTIESVELVMALNEAHTAVNISVTIILLLLHFAGFFIGAVRSLYRF